MKGPTSEVSSPTPDLRHNEPAADFFWRGDPGGLFRKLGHEEGDEGA
jgi:hypothetical protein